MMQAAFISYAVFLALLLLAVLAMVIFVGVKSLLAYIRERRITDEHRGDG